MRVRGDIASILLRGQAFAECTGRAPSDVVGLHGWARSHEDLAGPLSGLNALLIDLPGFGSSPEPPTAWGSDAYAELVAEALKSLHRPPVVVGHSFGGCVAVKLAAGWPELVSGVVLAGVPLLRCSAGSTPSWRFRAARWGSRHGVVSQDRMEKLRQRHGSEDYRRASGVMRSVLVRVVNESYEDDLRRISCPVELIWGVDDTAAPVEMAQRACELLPNARLEVIEDAGHMTPLSHPELLRSAVSLAEPGEHAVISDVISALTAAAVLGGGPRWLRIAQREHYIPGSVTRFALRWWLARPVNWALGSALAVSIGFAWAGWWEGAAAAAAVTLAAPVGLTYRGRSSKLAWTRRLKTVAMVAAALTMVIAVLGFLAGFPAGVTATLAACAPFVADLALAATAPLERRASARFVQAAARRLEEVSPRVVGITGSFGKTSTKFYTGHLLRSKYVTVTSPASFNNMAGLSRAINERLVDSTEVFVAEMGTYGPGRSGSSADGSSPRFPSLPPGPGASRAHENARQHRPG